MGHPQDGQPKKSRVTIGFHRLGIFTAAPLLLVSLGTAISAWFSDDGPYIPDRNIQLPVGIVLMPQATDRSMTDDELKLLRLMAVARWSTHDPSANKSGGAISYDTGPVRTFKLFQSSIHPGTALTGLSPVSLTPA
jgi:hypothetical protein